MEEIKNIKTALISVFSKDGLDDLVLKLHSRNVKILSTGGTQQYIEGLNVPVTPVEQLTDYPSILGGRVKTLHPKVFGGILSRRDEENDLKELTSYEIPEIDLVVVDLYPFEQTIESGAPHKDIIEKIDIGGVSLIRAAAKNYKDVTLISHKEDYKSLVNILNKNGAQTTLEERKYFAIKGFSLTANYDQAGNSLAGDKYS